MNANDTYTLSWFSMYSYFKDGSGVNRAKPKIERPVNFK